MGTFERIRQISPYAFGIFAVLLIAFFTIGDPTVTDGLRGTGGPQTAEIGSVNGEPIYYVDYERKVSQAIENQKAQMMQQNPGQQPEINYSQIRSEIWNEMVGALLLKQEAEKAGIIITAEMIADEMLNNPPEALQRAFRDSTGQFMKDMYLEIVTNPNRLSDYVSQDASPEDKQKLIDNFRNDLIAMEDYLRQVKLNNYLMSLVVSAGAVTSPNFIKMKYIHENSKADVWYRSFPANDFNVNEADITDAEIQEYYNANKQFFKQKNSRKIKYIALPLKPSAEDTAAAQRKINDINTAMRNAATPEVKDSIFDLKMAEFGGESHEYALIQDVDPTIYGYLVLTEKGDVVGPINKPNGTYFYRLDGKRDGENISVKASHILIKVNDNKDSAMAEANKILKMAKGDKDFAELAKEYSTGPSAPQGGDLGFFTKGKMVPEFEKAAFDANVNDVVGPVETQFGLHIIKVFEKRTEELAYSEIPIIARMSNLTQNKIFMEANSIAEQVNQGTPIDTIASRLGLKATETAFFQADRPTLGSKYLTDLIFNMKLGEVTKPEEYDRFGVVIAQLTDIREAGIKPLEDVKVEIIAKIKLKKQLDLAEEAAKKEFETVRQLGTLQAVNDSVQDGKTLFQIGMDSKFRVPKVGNDPIFVSTVFAMPENKISKPFRGDKGVYIIEVANKSVPTEELIKTNMNDYKIEDFRNNRNTIFNSWYVQVRDQSQIKDLRYKFFKEY